MALKLQALPCFCSLKVILRLNVLATLRPFAMWGIDMIRDIRPIASNGHRFILVAIDYFTMWVEAASFSTVTKNVVAQFIKHNLICRYGVLERTIIETGTNLNNTMITELCKQFKIQRHNSSHYRPKMNGTVEAANKNIKKILQNMTVTYKKTAMRCYHFLFMVTAPQHVRQQEQIKTRYVDWPRKK